MKKQETWIITGSNGQDARIMSALARSSNINLIGLARNSPDIKRILPTNYFTENRICDLTSATEVLSAIRHYRPDRIFNLGAASSVAESWKNPDQVMKVNFGGLKNIVEAVKKNNLTETRIIQTSSSEMFGNYPNGAIDEKSPLSPLSPYAESKARAHLYASDARERSDILISNAILFNHESPLRQPRFVFKKIIEAVVAISKGEQDLIELGDLSISRDWGWAPDYVRALITMSEHFEPEDFVVSTGISNPLSTIIDIAFKKVGISDWEKFVSFSSQYARPTEIKSNFGDSRKIKTKLNWAPTKNIGDIVNIMVDCEQQGTQHLLDSWISP